MQLGEPECMTYAQDRMQSLVERFCPNVHDAPITAAAFDATSGTVVTADARGVVAVQRPGEASPRLIFQPGTTVNGAIAVIRGGALVAVGDESGTVGVYRTQDGEPVFQEVREGSRGRVRAMRGLAINHEGSRRKTHPEIFSSGLQIGDHFSGWLFFKIAGRRHRFEGISFRPCQRATDLLWDLLAGVCFGARIRRVCLWLMS